MYENEADSLMELIEKTAEFDKEASTSDTKENALTFKRDENGILYSYDVETGEKVGQIFEHGVD
jgi:hypothetical protein